MQKIDNHALTWYMQEITMHYFGASLNFREFIQFATNVNTRQHRIVWFHLFSFLSHSAMISKYISPIDKKNPIAVERKKVLQSILDIKPECEILQRDARDNIEHFDERIDKWIGQDNKTIFEIVFADRSGFNFMNAKENHIKRVLILDELIFISEKRDSSKFELALRPLYEEIDKIGNLANNWIEQNSPFNFIYPSQQ